ncbi:MAG: FtsQ-type POTRA domain-containing protein [Candidatus Omnitrophica bacterium]|nr:FtsQ-type POTRA domain-containing protein [Candidatus Omnitrophota bacterium]
MARKSKIDIPTILIRNVIIVLFILLIICWMFSGMNHFLHNAPIFRIQHVSADKDVQFLESKILERLRGQNILNVDLRKLHREIRALFPQIYDLSVERRFPDTIRINAKRRDPFAQVLVKENYLTIDQEGVVIFIDPKASPKLPLIINSHLEKRKVVLGARLATPEIIAAIDVIEAFYNNNGLAKYPLSGLDVDNLSKISFNIGPMLQIILDKDDVAQKLETLVFLISQKKLDFREVKYIDLRFKEPVVGRK